MELKLLALRLRTADPRLKRDLRRNLRQAAGPVAGKVQAAILAMPSHHDGTLRGEVARTITVQATTARTVGISIASLGSRMPHGEATLPVHLNRARGWRHPVYGNRRNWAHQMGRPGFFDDTIRRNAGGFQDAARRAMNDTARHIEG